MRFLVIALLALAVPVGIEKFHDPRLPDAFERPVSNHCNPNGSQDFTFERHDGKTETVHFDYCLIRESPYYNNDTPHVLWQKQTVRNAR
jgi:hypothetical protein